MSTMKEEIKKIILEEFPFMNESKAEEIAEKIWQEYPQSDDLTMRAANLKHNECNEREKEISIFINLVAQLLESVQISLAYNKDKECFFVVDHITQKEYGILAF